MGKLSHKHDEIFKLFTTPYSTSDIKFKCYILDVALKILQSYFSILLHRKGLCYAVLNNKGKKI